MVVFLIGPLARETQDAGRAYLRAEQALRSEAHSLVSPRETGDINHRDWRKAHKKAASALLDCDGVALVAGWEESKLGQALARLAREHSKPFVDYDASKVVLTDSSI